MKWMCSICRAAVLLAGGARQAEAVPNEPINWGFKRSVNHQPPDAGKLTEQFN